MQAFPFMCAWLKSFFLPCFARCSFSPVPKYKLSSPLWCLLKPSSETCLEAPRTGFYWSGRRGGSMNLWVCFKLFYWQLFLICFNRAASRQQMPELQVPGHSRKSASFQEELIATNTFFPALRADSLWFFLVQACPNYLQRAPEKCGFSLQGSATARATAGVAWN
jgi:hypothetical protein